MSLAIVLIALGKIILGFVNPYAVRLSAEGITAPRNAFAHEPAWTPFVDIQRLERRKHGRHQSLVIVYRGDRLGLPRLVFRDDLAYQTFIRELMEAMQDRHPNTRYGYRQFV